MPTTDTSSLLRSAAEGILPEADQARQIAETPLSNELMQTAALLRDSQFGNTITYSRKVFLPLTQLCRDVCHYCTFAKTPKRIDSPYMSEEQVLAIARRGAELGCKEALLTLGEKPELRYRTAQEALTAMGFATTMEYTAHMAERILAETGLLPHINAGTMSTDEIAYLRTVSASIGIMLESASPRLCEKNMPHYGSPDKVPEVRLATLHEAGIASVPFTSGILIGIGESRLERVESLMALREVHRQYGHLQEIIVQNFRAKPDTKMAQAHEPDLDEMLWTLAVTRIIFGAEMSIQAPPNLSPGVLTKLVDAGINDWGGVSPLTPDHVNPEAPWPHLDQLAQETASAGKHLDERLTIYPRYVNDPDRWLAPQLQSAVLQLRDGEGFARADHWQAGTSSSPPRNLDSLIRRNAGNKNVDARLKYLIVEAQQGRRISADDIAHLFSARGDDFNYVCRAADTLRQQVNGDTVTYVVNRNINYTNICYFKCRFCAFSKGKTSAELRGKPYDISNDEIQRRVLEAWQSGATEVCMQGGIHPDYDGNKYLDIVRQVKLAAPDMHVHAFSPLEIWQGASTLGISVREFLLSLKHAGLNTLPGTAAEILDDQVRATLCPDKLNTTQWLEVIRTAHEVGLKTTATIMFGHVDTYRDWGTHLLAIRDLQSETGGFTEFVPLAFVGAEAPIYKRGQARNGPTYREAILMHAIGRLVLHSLIDNIQTSWVKMGRDGAAACLHAGANDMGGTLMNESITRAAGAQHGQELSAREMEASIKRNERTPKQRTTLYQMIAPPERNSVQTIELVNSLG